ncbi:MAG: hypothetical protein TEF_11895 [Rhizobiales bacterium NRL2]|nr:MAG: hypothetical protein TEF_11895 [Rhizobiales bacterium NRL2]
MGEIIERFDADERTARLIDSAIVRAPVNRACFDDDRPARKLFARQIRDWIGEIKDNGAITSYAPDSVGNQHWPEGALPWIAMALDEMPPGSERLSLSHLSPGQFLSACDSADVPILERAAELAERPRFGPRGSEGRDMLLFRLFDIWVEWKMQLPMICGDDTRETDIRRLVGYACVAAGYRAPSLATLNRRIRAYRKEREGLVDFC